MKKHGRGGNGGTPIGPTPTRPGTERPHKKEKHGRGGNGGTPIGPTPTRPGTERPKRRR
jgi:hypothetical protein